jgi:hypothetical protein
MDPKPLDPELEKLAREEEETMDKLQTMSLQDIIEGEAEGRLTVRKAPGPSTVEVRETDFDVEEFDGSLESQMRELLE